MILILLFLAQIFEELCGFIGFYTENILISFDNERLHTSNKEHRRKQMKLKKFDAKNNDTNEEDNTNVSDADDVSETFDEENDGGDDATSDNNNDDETFDDNNDVTDDEQDYDTDDQESDDEESDDEETDDEETDDEETDDESRHAKDLYYNPKSQAWEHSDEDN
jgi:hypothetical protein